MTSRNTLARIARMHGASFARTLRGNVMAERHMARRLRDFDIDALIEPTPGIDDAFGNGDTLRRIVDPNGARWQRNRTDIEELAEQFTGTQYPSWQALITALEGAQRQLDGTLDAIHNSPMGSWGDEPQGVAA